MLGFWETGGETVMQWAYVLENQGVEDFRSNQPIFLLITDLDLTDNAVFFDNSDDRPELKRLLSAMQTGDRLAVRSVVDMADSLDELKYIFKTLTDKEITLHSCTEPVFTGDGYLQALDSVTAVCTALQRKQRQAAYRQAQRAGKVGRPKKQTAIEKAVILYQSGTLTMAEIENTTGLSKSTIYRHLGGNKK